MSLTQPPGGGFGPPSGYPYPREGGDSARPPPPTLPSMSSLLNHEPLQQDPPQNPYMARQFQPPYNMTKQPQHPLFASQMDPNAPVQHIYHPPPSLSSHALEKPSEPMLMSLPHHQSYTRAQTSAVASQRRQAKSVKQRKSDLSKERDPELNRSEFRSEFNSDHASRYSPSEQNMSPTQHSFVQDPLSYSRRESTLSESSSQRMSSQTPTAKLPISGLLSDGPR